MEKTKVFVLICGLLAALAVWKCDAAALDNNEDEDKSTILRGFGLNLGSLGNILGGQNPLDIIGKVLNGGSTAPPAPSCNTNCPAPTGPDCAVCACCDGTDRTFDTQCCLDSYNCQNPKSQCTFKSNGQCPPACNSNCAGTGPPVCATCAGNTRQQFPTLCDLAYRNCSKPSDTCKYLCDGTCPPDCNTNCPTSGQQPVCATCYGVNVTLPSYCNFTANNCLNKDSCKFVSNGACPPPCSQYVCPTPPSYICANCSGSLMTFNSDCDKDKYNCNFKQNCQKVCDGKCAPQCDTNCPTSGQQPVCATCYGVNVTLPSYCNFTANNCLNKDSCKFVSNGSCPAPCSQYVCPTTPSYICANCSGSLMTFNSDCDKDKYNCNFKQNCQKVCDGKCAPQCDTNCPTSGQQPVCATCYGVNVTLPSYCNFTANNCLNKDSCKFVSNGACPPPCSQYVCPTTPSYVCANCSGSLMTFNSDCDKDKYNCNFKQNCQKVCDGKCAPQCDTNCPTSGQQPVCATCYGVNVTLPSYCNFTANNCLNKDSCKFVSNGSCLPPCSQYVCPTTPSYICANCSGSLMTFNSDCDKDKYNCNFKQNCQKICDGKCAPQCDTNCPTSGQQPVCATCYGVNVTLPSYCNFTANNCLNKDSCKFVSNGSCPPPCSQYMCPTTPSYVCANCSGSLMTFNSDCDKDKYNCNFKQNCQKVCDGKCAPQCDTNCPTSGQQPVCATCYGVNVTLPSYCNFTANNCLNKDSCKFVSNGSCPPPCSEYVCPTTPSYICANCSGSLMTFNSDCDKDKYNCNFKQNCQKVCDGKCAPQCDTNCPTSGQQPVCATCYGVNVTLPSYCNFTANNCLNKDSCKFVSNGSCPAPCSEYMCPTTPSYICANCSGSLMTFNSDCDKDKYNCQFKTKCTKSYDGKCKPLCPEICPAYYDPVCGCCDGETKVYSNQCFFNIALCKNPRCKQVPNSECAPKCDKFCPEIYKPVCGRCDQTTKLYPNQCFLDIEICKNPGCEKVPDSNCCPTSCPANSNTICAKCYGGAANNISQCQFDINNCKQSGSCVRVSDKPCPTPCPTTCPANSKIICAQCNGVVSNMTQCEFDIKNCNQPKSCEKVCDDDCSKRCPSPTSCPANSKTICAKCDGVVGNITQCLFDIKNCNKPKSCDKVSDSSCPTPCATSCPSDSKTICAKCYGGAANNISQCQFDINNCKQSGSCVRVSDKPCPTPCPTTCPANSKIICAQCNGVVSNMTQCEFDIKNCNQPKSCEKVCDDDCSKRCPSPTSCPANSKTICAKCDGVVGNITQCLFDIKNCNKPKSCYKVSDSACPPPCPTACTKIYDPICALCNGKKETVGNDCLFQQRICRDKANCKKLCKGECAVVCPDKCDESGPEVCAQKGSIQKSFCSKCFVAKANCDEQDKDDWVIVSQGVCPKNPCVDRCPDEETSPMCAVKSGKCMKFPNKCQFNKANCECDKNGSSKWKKVSDGDCPKDVCDKHCKEDDCPVCAKHSDRRGKKEFCNECQMDKENEGKTHKWEKHSDGKCSSH